MVVAISGEGTEPPIRCSAPGIGWPAASSTSSMTECDWMQIKLVKCMNQSHWLDWLKKDWFPGHTIPRKNIPSKVRLFLFVL